MPFRWDRPVGEYSKIWEPILANINIDGVGLALSANNVTAIAAPETLTDWIERTRKQKYPGIVHVDPWPASDQYTFYSHGVRSIPFSSTGGVVNHHHQPADTIQWISPPKLAEVVQFALEMIDHLSLLA